MKVKKQRIIFAYVLMELLLLNVSFFAVSLFKYGIPYREGYLPFILIYNFSWLVIVLINGSQDLYMRHTMTKRIKDQLITSIMFLGISSPFLLLFEIDHYSRTMIFGTVILFFAFDFLAFLMANKFISSTTYGQFSSRLLILGAEEKGQQVLDFTTRNKHLGYDVVGFLDDHANGSNGHSTGGMNVLGKIEDLPKVLEEKYVDEIVITLPSYKEKEIKYAIEMADYKGIRVNLIPDFVKAFGKSYHAYNIDEMPVIEMRRIPLDLFHNFIFKKAFDIFFAAMVLIFLSPVFLLIALLIKLDSKGPVFYKPTRKGQGGKEFTCFKFRSMYASKGDSTKGGTRSTVKNDPRITKVGKYLRKYDIDELPQFINVLKGDMSVVGPRPHRTHLNNQLQDMVERYMLRHYVKPGITGWAQVNGWRGPTETDEQKQERVKHDLWYIENWSFLLDLKIIFLTVFSRKTRVNAF